MIKANFSAYSTYVTDSLNQWDLNQVLQVAGLNLTDAPEVHFSNANCDRAIVRQSTMTNHVVTVGIPNSLLQDPLRIYAHIGIYEGRTFKVVELVEIPVLPRKRPMDYQIEDTDEEIYSFKRLENEIANVATKGDAALVKAVAHRGYSSGAPENTLPAYRLAKTKGFEYAECDIAFTSDNIAVLLHDSTIDRTSDGTGRVSDMTLAGLKAYDFGSWFGDAFAGTAIPTAEEFLLLCRNVGLKPYIELKAGNEAQITALVATVKKYGLLDATTWISVNASYLTYVKNAYSAARLGFVVNTITAEAIVTAQSLQTGENEVFIDSAGYTDAEIDLCIDAGLPLEVWTIDSEESITNLPAYISGITSNSLHAGSVLYAHSME